MSSVSDDKADYGSGSALTLNPFKPRCFSSNYCVYVCMFIDYNHRITKAYSYKNYKQKIIQKRKVTNKLSGKYVQRKYTAR